MKKTYVNCIIKKKIPHQISYLIVEYSGIDPIKFLRKVIQNYSFGVLFLGHDAPSLLSVTETNKMIERMNQKGIKAVIKSGFIWLDSDEFSKIYRKTSGCFSGDAFILTNKPIDKDFVCTSLPRPCGLNKDKISSKDMISLNKMLSENDVYIHDKFTESFIVTKNTMILDIIHDEIKKV